MALSRYEVRVDQTNMSECIAGNVKEIIGFRWLECIFLFRFAATSDASPAQADDALR
jgi:hypothetical protein